MEADASNEADLVERVFTLWRMGVMHFSLDTKNDVMSMSSVSLREAFILKVFIMGFTKLRLNAFSMGSPGTTRS